MIIRTFALVGSLAFSANTQAYTDFSGEWSGQCEVNNGQAFPSHKEIKNSDIAFEINGFEFSLVKPTSTQVEDLDNGDRFAETTVYEFLWNEDQTKILTSAQWLGWYLDKPGSWYIKGAGVIKIENNELATTRSFDGRDEVCRYQKI